MIKAQFLCNFLNLDNPIEVRFYDYLFYVPQKIDFIPTIEMEINLWYFILHREIEEILEEFIKTAPENFFIRKISRIIIVTNDIIEITID